MNCLAMYIAKYSYVAAFSFVPSTVLEFIATGHFITMLLISLTKLVVRSLISGCNYAVLLCIRESYI